MSLRNRRQRLRTIHQRMESFPEIRAEESTDFQDLEFSAGFEFVPGDINAEGKDAKLPKIKLTANSGQQPMDLNGFMDPVIINIRGVKFASKQTPIIADHDPTRRIGHAVSQSVDAKKGILANGLVSSVSADAESFKADAANGYPFQVSVGARILDGYFVAEGETATVNGKQFKGPLIVAKKTLIREFSVLTLGADPKTSASIAATLKGKPMNEFEKWLVAEMGFTNDLIADMSDEQRKTLNAKWKKETEAPAPVPTPAPKEVKAEEKNEPEDIEATAAKKIATVEKQADEIKAAFSKYPDVKEVEYAGKKITVAEFKATALEKRMDVRDVRLALLEAETPKAGEVFNIHIKGGDGADSADVLTCGIMRAHGVPQSGETESGKKYGWETLYPEKTLEASDRFKNIGLHQLVDMAAEATGMHFRGNRKSMEYVRHTLRVMQAHQQRMDLQASPGAGPFSTLGITNILEDAANKTLLTMYQLQDMKWDQIARARSVNDFKTQNFYRLSVDGLYKEVGANGQLEHGTMSDEKHTLSIDTYGMLMGLGRKDIINDDLNAFMDVARGLGMRAAMALECTVWKAFLALSFTGSITDALGIAGLTTAETAFQNRVGTNGEPILVSPSRLVTGTAQGVTARQLFGENKVLQESLVFESNPHAGSFTPVVSPMVNNTNIKNPTDGAVLGNQSATAWFLLADPNVIAALNVGFLGGNQTPILEQGDVSFDTLGVQWRCYHDFGTGSADVAKAVIKSTGVGGSG